MVDFLLWAMLLSFVACFVFLIGLLIDLLTGTPLSGQVRVTGRKFTPRHFEWRGRERVRVPDRWTLHAENSNGRGIVAVPKPLHDSITEGESIQVSGTRGRISKRW